MTRGSFLPVANEFLLDPRFGPEMVRRRARILFDYYLHLLRRQHESDAVEARLEVRSADLAGALDLGTGAPATALNRCNHQLAELYDLVRYEPAPGRTPRIELLDPRDSSRSYRPPERNYFPLSLQYWKGGWDKLLSLKAKFFLLVSIHEHVRNTPKRETDEQGQRYWFRPVEDLAARYHIAARTVTSALKELWKAGILGVERGSYQAGRANRYYYRDIAFTPSYRARFDELMWELGEERYAEARDLAERLDAENRPEAIALMAELVEEHGKDDVVAAVEMLAGRSLRSPVRTPEYVRGILRNWSSEWDRGPMMVREVPFLGYVAAGPPVLAEEQALGTLSARVPARSPGRLFALAPECNRSIVDASIQWMQHLRDQTGTHHQIIAVACSQDHSRQVGSLYAERGLRVQEIHSNLPNEEIEEILQDLRRHRLDCIVQVRMLGEGFDHPYLSVAAIFQPFRSLSPYIQFAGRVMRVLQQDNPQHPDNRGIVVSHVGLNIDRHWDDFRQIDEADQEMIREWLEAPEADPPEVEEGRRRRLNPSMVVQDEIISHFIEQDYLDPMDDAVIDDLMEEFRRRGLDPDLLGLTREDLRQRLIQARTRASLEPREIPVTPQRRRQELRRRLDEQSRVLANRIPQALGVAVPGRDIATLYPELRSVNNFGAVIQLVHSAVNHALGIERRTRGELPIERIEAVLDDLDAIGDRVEQGIRDRLQRREES